MECFYFADSGKKIWLGIFEVRSFFLKNNERALVMDSDIVFLGRALDTLEQYDEDFIVSGDLSDDPRAQWFKNTYYHYDLLRNAIDVRFNYLGFTFNTGQIVATCGKIERRDLDGLVDWLEPPVVKRPDIFSCQDQGILNYVLCKKRALGQISIRSVTFWLWIGYSEGVGKIELESIIRKEGYPLLLHWAIPKPRAMSRFIKIRRYDLLRFYESIYYSKVPLGLWKRWMRNGRLLANFLTREAIRKIAYYSRPWIRQA